MFDLITVTRAPDRTVRNDASGQTETVPGPITDVRGSVAAVFGLPILLAVITYGTSLLIEDAKLENAKLLETHKEELFRTRPALPPQAAVPAPPGTPVR